MAYSFESHRIQGGIAADAEYWRGLEDGEFRISRCNGCDRWTWPAHYRCGICGSWDFRWEAVEPVGTVFSWTKTWMSFETVKERAGDLPYVTILAEIPHAGNVRVLGVLKGTEEGLRIGAPVRGTIDPPSETSKWHAAIRWSLT